MKKAKLQINYRRSYGITKYKGISLVLSGALVSLISPLFADSVNGINAPSGSYDAPPNIVAPSGTYATPSVNFSPTTSPADDGQMTVGHLPVLFSASVAEVYDDNIFVQPVKVDDFITQINLMGEFKIGNDKAVDAGTFDIFYAPSFDIYANHSSQDSFNNNVGAQYFYRFSKLTLGVSQTYNRNSSSSAPVGNLVTTSNYVTKLSADYSYSDKLSVVGNFSQIINNYVTGGYSSSNEWFGDLYFLYKFDSKLSAGFGPRFGWLDVTQAPNQTYQQLLGRVDYDYSKKLSFNLSGGAEIREYEGPNPTDKVSPVFSLSSSYQPWTGGFITLEGSRAFNPSYNLFGQDYMATKVDITGRQRFLQNFYFNLGLGYEHDQYSAAGTQLTGPARVDNYYFATTGLTWVPNTWLSSSIFYRYQTDDSNFSGFTFNDNQVGVSVGFSY